MKEQDVVTLEDGKEYLLLDELDYGHKKYFFSVEVNENDEIINPDKGIFLQVIKENGETYLEEVTSQILLEKLTTLETVSLAMLTNDEYREGIEKLIEEEQKGGK